ncbi:hypothetical protein [Salipiger bermudensis]|uniref:Uncharacterized protein n=1 Tax=Salipiger bermudensis (strain DSM 26914 / JCM 13377 / KCTC 12554 / HTCC2601) TaxID=314265 RepID=Q0FLI5_SALBH|nr:hypothetical protein [Salipiger bermudensis]EAU45113.1 hypothetical protein R2601_23041 [Salipiger bermudensis HTCC2601]
MSEQENWKWWVGHDDERFHTECETREEAVYIATEEQEGGHIVEAMKPANIEISRFFDAHLFVESAEDDAAECHGDPEGDILVFDLKPEVRADLEKMVRAAMDAWQEKHSLTFTGFQFAASRNHEYVPAKAESE